MRPAAFAALKHSAILALGNGSHGDLQTGYRPASARRHYSPLEGSECLRGVEKYFWTKERPDMRGVAPSLFGKPPLGRGLSTRSRISKRACLITDQS
jgi:hypothetical protein